MYLVMALVCSLGLLYACSQIPAMELHTAERIQELIRRLARNASSLAASLESLVSVFDVLAPASPQRFDSALEVDEYENWGTPSRQ